jgi:hypothetical protein
LLLDGGADARTTDRSGKMVMHALLDLKLMNASPSSYDQAATMFNLLVQRGAYFDTDYIREALDCGILPLARKMLVAHGTFASLKSVETDESQQLEILSKLLEVHFDNIAVDDLSSLKDLSNTGLNYRDLALLFTWTPAN